MRILFRADNGFRFELGGGGVILLHVGTVYTLRKRTESILEVGTFLSFRTPFYPLEANLFEPNPVGKKYSIKTGIIEYSIKTVQKKNGRSYE